VLRLGVRSFPPFLFTFLRQVTAGLILTGYLVFVMKMPWPSRNHILRQVVGGFLLITLGNGLVSWASMYIPSSVAAIICSTLPIWVILLNLSVNRAERPNLWIISGVIIGISGIIMVFREHLEGFSDPKYSTAIALVFVAEMAWAIASFMMKKSNQTVSPFMNAGLQMIFGGLICVPLSLIFDDYSVMAWSSKTIYPLIYLILIGSVAAQAMYSYIITVLPLTIASMYSYINPLVAVLLGWLVLSEKLNLNIAIAILITVFGIYLVNSGYNKLSKKKT
jgi:drug/metabolite transporter (DMT)-like permease